MRYYLAILFGAIIIVIGGYFLGANTVPAWQLFVGFLLIFIGYDIVEYGRKKLDLFSILRNK